MKDINQSSHQSKNVEITTSSSISLSSCNFPILTNDDEKDLSHNDNVSKEIRDKQVLEICHAMEYGNIPLVRDLYKEVNDETFSKYLIESTNFKEICREELIIRIKNKDIKSINKLIVCLEEIGVGKYIKEIIDNKEIKSALKTLIIDFINDDFITRISDLNSIKEKGFIDAFKELMCQDDLINVCYEKLAQRMTSYPSKSLEIIEFVKGLELTNLFKMFTNSAEFKDGLNRTFLWCVQNEDSYDTISCVLFPTINKMLQLGLDNHIVEAISNNEFKNAYKEYCLKGICRGVVDDISLFFKFLKENSLDDVLESIVSKEEILKASKQFLNNITKDDIDNLRSVINFMKENGFNDSVKEFLSEKKYAEIAKEAFLKNFTYNHISHNSSLVMFFKENDLVNVLSEIVCSEELKKHYAKEFVDYIRHKRNEDFFNLISEMKECGLNDALREIISTQEFKEAYIEEYLKHIANGQRFKISENLEDNGLYDIIHEFISTDNCKMPIKNLLKDELSNNHLWQSYRLMNFMSENNIVYERLQNFMNDFGYGDYGDLLTEIDAIFLGEYVLNNDDQIKIISKNDIESIDTPFIRKFCLSVLQDELYENGTIVTKSEDIYNLLKTYDSRWQDRQIFEPFEKGVEYFGYELMFKYLGGKNVVLHDALMNFDKVCKFCDKFCKSDKERKIFFNNILRQVADDTSLYNEGTSYNYLNTLIRNFETIDIDDVLIKGRKLQDSIPEINDIVEYYSDKKNIVASWKDLKNFMKLKEIVDNEEFVKILCDIHKENIPLYDYIKPLLFHKDSKVDVNAIKEFIFEPEKFFERLDTISDDIHKDLRPSNYFAYGLSPVELRQAFVEGKLNNIQCLEPESKIYVVNEGNLLSVSDYLLFVVGSRNRKIKGQADFKTAKAIYDEIKTELGIDLRNVFLNGKNLSSKEEIKIIKIVNRLYKKAEVLKAQIHAKNDPKAAVVGDDTACCMPFGSGKMNEYLFNPANAIFSISRLGNDGSFKTIAQSVLTLDADIGKTGTQDLTQVNDFSFDSLAKKLVLVCDNIETARNYGDKNPIESVYKEFFDFYLNNYSKYQYLDDSRVIIGKGYSKALTSLSLVPNTFIPVSLVGYSDNNPEEHKESYILEFKREKQNNDETNEDKDDSLTDLNRKYLVSMIDASDILQIAMMESVIYSGDLRKGIVSLQNRIIANIIKNEIYDKKSMMLKVVDKKTHLPYGYMVAYERNAKNGPEICFFDFAVRDPKKNMIISAKMLKLLLKYYIEQYRDTDILPPIALNLRESTSYQFVKSQERIDKLNKLLSKYGLKCEFIKESEESYGGETFHKGRLVVSRS